MTPNMCLRAAGSSAQWQREREKPREGDGNSRSPVVVDVGIGIEEGHLCKQPLLTVPDLENTRNSNNSLVERWAGWTMVPLVP